MVRLSAEAMVSSSCLRVCFVSPGVFKRDLALLDLFAFVPGDLANGPCFADRQCPGDRERPDSDFERS